MRRFLDASILVEACLAQSPKFAAADALVKTSGAVTSAHALAETYATLSGDARLKINPHDAAQMVGELAQSLQIHALAARSYLALIEAAPAAGIRGGSSFDAIHAQAARETPMNGNSHPERQTFHPRRPGIESLGPLIHFPRCGARHSLRAVASGLEAGCAGSRGPFGVESWKLNVRRMELGH